MGSGRLFTRAAEQAIGAQSRITNLNIAYNRDMVEKEARVAERNITQMRENWSSMGNTLRQGVDEYFTIQSSRTAANLLSEPGFTDLIAKGDNEAFKRLRWLRKEDQQMVGAAVMAPISQMAQMEFAIGIQNDNRLSGLGLNNLSPEERVAKEAELLTEYKQGPYQTQLRQLAKAFPQAASTIIPQYMQAVGAAQAKAYELRAAQSLENSRQSEVALLLTDMTQSGEEQFYSLVAADAMAATEEEALTARNRLNTQADMLRRGDARRLREYVNGPEGAKAGATRLYSGLRQLVSDQLVAFEQTGQNDRRYLERINWALARIDSAVTTYDQEFKGDGPALGMQIIGGSGKNLKELVGDLQRQNTARISEMTAGAIKATVAMGQLDAIRTGDPTRAATQAMGDMIQEGLMSGSPAERQEAMEALQMLKSNKDYSQRQFDRNKAEVQTHNYGQWRMNNPGASRGDAWAVKDQIGVENAIREEERMAREGPRDRTARALIQEEAQGYVPEIAQQIFNSDEYQNKLKQAEGLGTEEFEKEKKRLMGQAVKDAEAYMAGMSDKVFGLFANELTDPQKGLSGLQETGALRESFDTLIQSDRNNASTQTGKEVPVPLSPRQQKEQQIEELADAVRTQGFTDAAYTEVLPELEAKLKERFPGWDNYSTEQRIRIREREFLKELGHWEKEGETKLQDALKNGLRDARTSSTQQEVATRPNLVVPSAAAASPVASYDQMRVQDRRSNYDLDAAAALNAYGGTPSTMNMAHTEVVSESVTVPPPEARGGEQPSGGPATAPPQAEVTTTESQPMPVPVANALGGLAGASVDRGPVNVINSSAESTRALAAISRGEARLTADTPMLPQVASDAPAQRLPLDVRNPDHPWSLTQVALRNYKLRNYKGPIYKPNSASLYNTPMGAEMPTLGVASIGSTNVPKPASINYEQASNNQGGIDVWWEDHQFRAVMPGVVKEVGYQGSGSGASGRGYGNFVVIESTDPVTGQKVDVLYGHLGDARGQGINVQEGQQVPAGMVIGKQGSTGRVLSADNTIASIDFLAPAAKGSGSQVKYKDFVRLRKEIGQLLESGNVMGSSTGGTRVTQEAGGAPSENLQRAASYVSELESDNKWQRNPNPTVDGTHARGFYQFNEITIRDGEQRFGIPNFRERIESRDKATATGAFLDYVKAWSPQAYQAAERGDWTTFKQLMGEKWTSMPGAAEAATTERQRRAERFLQG